ncbi:bifunctional glutamate N-acetyltransferase/amino-acid acetyltransferase ArgJ [Arsenicicoccus dermatophilus]|uniref:bifunctional glutamate N-acetyltransferase/amino-acid acetyltransferase ArgJ n=1 Tax=Arsenicicoccus dermatophilus TaxID=1076331 RepID=UPI001F4C686F|nr:bifunctional glutamate N-acetyltransferase/amino-acid acetyltransferase ArgJ [Arsenicicoccus dermatophilus]MCH8613190.1 bifunctional glutamate N-acetyltransferase/amino-acid acetyltransferase ArgJ [Arsenicicoccus dermatophilus]
MSVTAARGFRACGVAAGLKASGRPDVALVVDDGPDHHGAAVFTTNRVEAAPVTWSRQVVRDGRVDAVILNSGGANACTGPEGFLDTHRTAEQVAGLLGISASDVVVASTGLIGERLPMDRLGAGVAEASRRLDRAGGEDAAVAIMTTDTRPKQAVRTGAGWVVGGMAKGAGMLAPSLATMLVVLTTDAVVDPEVLDRALRRATARSFDRVDSDGCRSTNDMVLLMSSGASGIRPSEEELTALMTDLCLDLARQLVADAEGAHHDIAVEVVGAAGEDDALEVARAVARNALLKCAILGQDPNWGRVVAAVGTTGATFDPQRIDVSVNGIQVCRATAPGDPRKLVDLSGREVHVLVDLHAGTDAVVVWTNDLTHDYVHENSAYST